MRILGISIRNLGIMGFGFLVALVLAEIFLRLIGWGTPTMQFISDPILRIRGITGGEFDSRGFRNARAISQADIVVFGDSQTLGLNAKPEESWPSVLAKMSGFTVYQMAMSGWSLPQYSILIPEALRLRPSLVIVGVYLGNDLLESYQFFNEDDENSLPNIDLPTALAVPGQSVRSWLYEHLRLYRLVGVATRSLRENIGFAESQKQRDEKLAMWVAENPDIAFYSHPPRTILSSYYRNNAVDLTNVQTRAGLALSLRFLKAIKEKLRTTALAVVIIPTKESVYGNDPRLHEFVLNEAEVRSNIEKWCYENDVPCIDPRQTMFEKLEEEISLYPQTFDGHPVAAGYSAIAEAVSAYLQEHPPAHQ